MYHPSPLVTSTRVNPLPTADRQQPSTLVYRSRAVKAMSPGELRELTLAAQVRNRTESITGLLLYDRGTFFQWLEGPEQGLKRVLRSINTDARHEEIRVLEHRS